jgi:hypothetical protein
MTYFNLYVCMYVGMSTPPKAPGSVPAATTEKKPALDDTRGSNYLASKVVEYRCALPTPFMYVCMYRVSRGSNTYSYTYMLILYGNAITVHTIILTYIHPNLHTLMRTFPCMRVCM